MISSNVTYSHVLAWIKGALGDLQATALKNEIDNANGKARVISGPHGSESDAKIHVTIHCVSACAIYHLRIKGDFKSKQHPDKWTKGQLEQFYQGGKTGHPKDDFNAPVVQSVVDLQTNY